MWQYVKHKMQITRERFKYDLTTQLLEFYATNDFSIVRRWQ